MKKEQDSSLDWQKDELLRQWLENRKPNTVELYRSAMVLYHQFLSEKYKPLSPKQMILERAKEDKLEPWERGAVRRKVTDFNKWLREEAIKQNGDIGYASKSAESMTAAIANFYDVFNVPINVRWGRDVTAAPKRVNRSVKLNAGQVERLAYYAPTLRDKAIIWCMFQSGMDISTVLGLNYGDIAKEIEDPPMGALMLHELQRKKRGETIVFDSFFYRTAIQHLKRYLTDRFGENYASRLKYDTPLFMGKEERRLGTQNFQNLLREIAPLTEIETARMKEADINPLRPHCLRASFSDQLATVGANQVFVDYLSGHAVPYDAAYFGGEEGLRKSYVQYAEEVLEPKNTGVEETKQMERDIESLQRLNAQLQGEVKEIRTMVFKIVQEVLPGIYDKDEIEELMQKNSKNT